MTSKELRALRTRLGLTQQQMAEALNQSLITISRWEKAAPQKAKGVRKKAPGKEHSIPPETATLLECLVEVLDAEDEHTGTWSHERIVQAVKHLGVEATVGLLAASGELSQERRDKVLDRLLAYPKWRGLGAVIAAGFPQLLGPMGATPFTGSTAFLAKVMDFMKRKGERKEGS